MGDTAMNILIWWKRSSTVKRTLIVFAGLLCIGLTAGALRSWWKFIYNKDICLTPGCYSAASTVLANMDPSVEPCDDFYRFACGGFLKSTIIPDDKVSIDTFTVIGDNLQQQLRASIEAKSEPTERKPFRLVKNLYKSCMNTSVIEKKGPEPLKKILKELGGWPVLDGDSWNDDEFNWTSSIYKFRDIGYSIDYFISFKIVVDLKNSTKSVIHLDQSTLGLPREYLSSGFNNVMVSAYYMKMVVTAMDLGADVNRTIGELKESLSFEMELAKISFPTEKRRNATRLYNPMTIKELTKSYPEVPWGEYFSKLLPSIIRIEEDEVIIVNVPSYITDLVKLISRTEKRIQANYVMWRAVADSVSYLSDDLRKTELKYSSAFNESEKRASRWKECVDIVSKSLPKIVGATYVRQYFNEETKKNAAEMVMNIRQQFNQMLKKVAWMDEKTRNSALEKAKAMLSHLAYPDELLDDNYLEEYYEKLELSEDNYLKNMLDIWLFDTNYTFSQLRKPVDKTNWLSHGIPATVNAHYSVLGNSILLPAGILQGSLFNNDRPRYMNYGAIGSIIGHEITHGFDDRGRQFDKDGNLVDWWAPLTKENYLKRVECIIHQYGNYTVDEVGLNLNGIKQQGENIADNGGIKMAYLAYNNWMKRNGPEKKLPGINRTPEQMFWISAANVWCSKIKPEYLNLSITTDIHSPSEFRVHGPFSNMREFAGVFMCPEGSRMNPKKKCPFW